MAVMTVQMPLSVVAHANAVLIGAAAAPVEDREDGRVFLDGAPTTKRALWSVKR